MLLCTQWYTVLEFMLQKIGIREFRNKIAQYLNTSDPIAVTRHGQTVGYFLPTHQDVSKVELEKLKQAAQTLDALLAEAGVTEDELVNEFRQLRDQAVSHAESQIIAAFLSWRHGVEGQNSQGVHCG